MSDEPEMVYLDGVPARRGPDGEYLGAPLPAVDFCGLRLPERAANILCRSQIDTLEKLTASTKDDLLALTRFGEGSLKAVTNALAAQGLSLASGPEKRERRRYLVNEIFFSLQGEGVRAGTPNVFVRFARCNLKCDIEPGPQSPGGFACDTEFVSGRWYEAEELEAEMRRVGGACNWTVLTGGEPTLQVDAALAQFLRGHGWHLAVETNGTRPIRFGADWVTVSPKVAEHALKQLAADELKYVRAYGQGIPQPRAKADHYLISPAFDGDDLDQRTLAWCIELVKENPQWRLSCQAHKLWSVR